MSEEGVRYMLELSTTGKRGEHLVQMEIVFRPTCEDITKEHPIDVFGPAFLESLRSAGFAFADPNVREVPVYVPGDLEPIGHVRRLAE